MIYRKESRHHDPKDDDKEEHEITKFPSSFAAFDGDQLLGRIRWASHTQIDLHQWAAKGALGDPRAPPLAGYRRRIRH
jgi:hypothetical protein